MADFDRFSVSKGNGDEEKGSCETEMEGFVHEQSWFLLV